MASPISEALQAFQSLRGCDTVLGVVEASASAVSKCLRVPLADVQFWLRDTEGSGFHAVTAACMASHLLSVHGGPADRTSAPDFDHSLRLSDSAATDGGPGQLGVWRTTDRAELHPGDANIDVDGRRPAIEVSPISPLDQEAILQAFGGASTVASGGVHATAGRSNPRRVTESLTDPHWERARRRRMNLAGQPSAGTPASTLTPTATRTRLDSVHTSASCVDGLSLDPETPRVQTSMQDAMSDVASDQKAQVYSAGIISLTASPVADVRNHSAPLLLDRFRPAAFPLEGGSSSATSSLTDAHVSYSRSSASSSSFSAEVLLGVHRTPSHSATGKNIGLHSGLLSVLPPISLRGHTLKPFRYSSRTSTRSYVSPMKTQQELLKLIFPFPLLPSAHTPERGVDAVLLVTKAVNENESKPITSHEDVTAGKIIIEACNQAVIRIAQVAEVELHRIRYALTIDMLRAISSEDDTASILKQLGSMGQQLLLVDRVSVFRVDRAQNVLILAVSEDALGMQLPIGSGIVGRAVDSGQAVLVNDAYASEHFDRSMDVRTGYRTKQILAVPIKDPIGNVVAVVQALNKVRDVSSPATVQQQLRPDSFSKQDVETLTVVANAAGVALHKAALLEAAEAARAINEALLDVVRGINELPVDADDTMSTFSRRLEALALRLVPAECMRVFFVDQGRHELYASDIVELEHPDGPTAIGSGGSVDSISRIVRARIDRGITGRCAVTGATLNVNLGSTIDTNAALFFPDIDCPPGLSVKKPTSMLLVPIKASSEGGSPQPASCIAVVQATTFQRGATFTSLDEALLSTFALEISSLLDRKSLHLAHEKALADMSVGDSSGDAIRMISLLDQFMGASEAVPGAAKSKHLQGRIRTPIVMGRNQSFSLLPSHVSVRTAGHSPGLKGEEQSLSLSKATGGIVTSIQPQQQSALSYAQRQQAPGQRQDVRLDLSKANSAVNSEPFYRSTLSPRLLAMDSRVRRRNSMSSLAYPGQRGALGVKREARNRREADASLSLLRSASADSPRNRSAGPFHAEFPAEAGFGINNAGDACESALETGRTYSSDSNNTQAESLENGVSPSELDNPRSSALLSASTRTRHSSRLRQESASIRPIGSVATGGRETAARSMHNSSCRSGSQHDGGEGFEDAADLRPWLNKLPRKGREAASARLLEMSFNPLLYDSEELQQCALDMVHLMDIEFSCTISIQGVAAFIKDAAELYLVNPYHNFQHAMSVMHICFLALRRCYACAVLLDPIQKLAVLLAALAHDLDHPGVSNSHEASLLSDLALRYNDLSILEQHHAATMFRLLRVDSAVGSSGAPTGNAPSLVAKDMGALEPVSVLRLSRADFLHFRAAAIAGILATDMRHHDNLTGSARAIRFGRDFLNNDVPPRLLIELLLHSADLSNPVLPDFEVVKEWALRVCKEFTVQVEREKRLGMPFAPHMDGLNSLQSVARMQCGFLDYVVQPLWSVLVTNLLPELAEVRSNLAANRASWAALTNVEVPVPVPALSSAAAAGPGTDASRTRERCSPFA